MAAQVLLQSAARTSNQVVPLPSWDGVGYHGILLYLNITVASGTGGLTLQLQYTDPVSGTVQNQPIGSARTATGLFIAQAGPVSSLAALSGGSFVTYLPADL